MVVEIAGVTKTVPVPIEDPPVAEVYQLILAPTSVPPVKPATTVTEPVSHRDPAVVTTIGGVVIIVACIAILAEVAIHPFDVSACA